MIFANDSDQDWETWGKADPYFAVLTATEFLAENLDDTSLQRFFESGENHIHHIYNIIRTKVKPGFQTDQVLDYGCGVGRLVIPLAQRAQVVVGIDVSTSMLERARENCNKFDQKGVRLLHVDELDSLPPASFDLVHSVIVFQHIPVDRGYLILRKLISLLASGGVGAIHFTYADTRHPLRRNLSALRTRLPLVHNMLNLMKRRPFSAPLMQMNNYSMNRIFDILMESHCSNLHVELANTGSHRGAMLYFEKS
jgi:SAM-dependent methyltransferase